ncbi:hypothetical protein FN846DRAFT_908978 [Sphaerosporella brunnea]|uniref:NADH-ubiquinone reductase complex 1 MLRQ subunit-domain-containing protein n=1 Tax=Sphaerosporella brunnea TaxID=1250544 RepID=A0A5J5ER40_9PEZI|nr:hypothetical protein FN846DRAFT_908978 [Sphaerosporella brunnea]
MPMPKEQQSAHTITQRIRQLKKVPPELFPIGIVVGAALCMGAYSITRKFYVDRTLRLNRSQRDGH